MLRRLPMSGAWAPLAEPIFRALWIAAVASNIGTWMQSVGAAWLMTSLTRSPLLIALLTTAGSLPIFLAGLPAGALADVFDKRHIVLLTQFWMLIVAAAMGVVTFLGWMNPSLLLLLSFLLGLGGALSAPAWQAIMPELVGKEQLATAVALNGAGFNLARAVGPALGGFVVAAAGPGAVFLINAVSFLAVVWVILRWERPVEHAAADELPPERVIDAIQSGGRYAWHAAELRAVMVRTAACVIAGSALWALIPVVATQDLKLGATGYGVLLGSIGFGAVGGAFGMPALKERFSIGWIVTGSAVVFAATILALGYVRNFWLLNAALLVTGATWLLLTSALNVAAQTTVPKWVQARALGAYLLVFQGCFAGGSAAWGAVAARLGNSTALLLAAALLAAGQVVALRWRIRTGEDLDLNPAQQAEPPDVVVEPAPEEGPVLITIAYQVADGEDVSFVAAMHELRVVRLRDGATSWDLFVDPADPRRYVEVFLVPSWGEYLRQQGRMTMADREIEDRALAYQQRGTAPVTSHLIAARLSSTVVNA